MAAPALVGFVAGTFDVFNLGHLHLLRAARERCQQLIVGVATDELVEQLAGVPPAVAFVERMAITQSVRYVDMAVPQQSVDPLEMWYVLKFDVLFVAADAPVAAHHREQERTVAAMGVHVVHLPSPLPAPRRQ